MRMRVLAGVCLLVVSLTVSAQVPEDPNPVVMTINGEPLRAAEIGIVAQNMAAEMQQRGMPVDQEQLLHAATQQVVDVRLLAQEARRLEVAPDQGRVAGIIDQIASSSGGREALEASLAKNGMSLGMLERAVDDSETVRALVEQRIKPGVSVSDEEVETFYADNPDSFQNPEEVRARHILIEVEQGADEAARSAARGRAEKARERAMAGEDFAALASELSEGPSASRGGDLGSFSAEQMVEPFSKAAFELKTGEISDVVETRFGFHVIKLEERRAASTQKLDEVRGQLQSYLEERQVGEQVQTLLESLHEKAEIVEAVSPGTPDTAPESTASEPPPAAGGEQ